jgi:hypothetical protein
MGKSHREKRWYDEPRIKEVRKGADKVNKHRKNLYKYSRDSLSEDTDNSNSEQDFIESDYDDFDEVDEYDTWRSNK